MYKASGEEIILSSFSSIIERTSRLPERHLHGVTLNAHGKAAGVVCLELGQNYWHLGMIVKLMPGGKTYREGENTPFDPDPPTPLFVSLPVLSLSLSVSLSPSLTVSL